MRILIAISWTLMLAATGCTGNESASEPDSTPAAGDEQAAAAARGGTITVGEQTWAIIPRSCSVYPGPIVNISGRAANDPALEIVIDYGGPDQVVVGSGRATLWHARKETLDVQVEGRRVRGTATFTENFGGSGKSASGSFEVSCG